jgi:uncharacterized protein (TIGR03118 family)
MLVTQHRIKLAPSIGLLIALLCSHAFGQSRHYKQTNLVSDLSGTAAHRDGNLVNPWGIVRSSTGPFWISDNGKGVSTLYDGSGNRFPSASPLTVKIPLPPGGSGLAAPTGVAFNGENDDFDVAPNNPAIFIFVTEDGTISAWNPNVNVTNAIRKVNLSGKAVYKGVALAKVNSRRFLYAANFQTGEVDVFSATFTPVRFSDHQFKDDSLPDGYAPFNVQNVGGRLYVEFAKRGEGIDEQHGAGLGFVDVFSPSGNLLGRLQHGSFLNAPWAVVEAPADFGAFSGDLLVGNFGSGRICAFDPVTGAFLGFLQNPSGSTIVIPGLWGLTFGNGGLGGITNVLYFTAGIDDEAHGLFGSLQSVP